MQSFIIGGRSNLLSTSNTEYNAIDGGGLWTTLSDNANQLIATPGTLTSLRVEVDTAPGNSGTFTFAVMVNGSPSGLEVAIVDPATSGDDTDTIAVSAGDDIQLRCIPTDSPDAGADARWSVGFTSTNSAESNLGFGSTASPSLSVTEFNPVVGGGSWTTSEVIGNNLTVCPTDGTLRDLYVELNDSPGAGDSFVFTVMKNGSPTGLVVTIAEAATTGNNTSDTVDVVPGDTLSIECNPDGTPSARLPRLGMTFLADIDGESIEMHMQGGVMSASANRYTGINGLETSWDSGFSASDPRYDIVNGACVAKKFVGELVTAPSAGQSFDFTIGDDAAGNTSITFEIADTATTGGDSVNTAVIAADSVLTIECDPTGTPTTSDSSFGLVLFVAIVGAVTKHFPSMMLMGIGL